MPLITRRLTDRDGHAYRRLRLLALQVNPEAFLSVYEVEASKEHSAFGDELEYAIAFPSYGYYGVFDHDPAAPDTKEKLVAFGQIGKSYLAKQQHTAWIYNVFVESTYRRQGLAAHLLNHMMAAVTSTEPIELFFVGCNAHNKPALRLYSKLGFHRCGIHPRGVKWLGQYDDEIQMVKVWSKKV